jgi:hypothetical protein
MVMQQYSDNATVHAPPEHTKLLTCLIGVCGLQLRPHMQKPSLCNTLAAAAVFGPHIQLI